VRGAFVGYDVPAAPPSPRRFAVQPGTWVTLLTDDMGNTFLVLFSSVSVAEPVGLWATPLRCPHVHRLASRLSQPVLAVIDHAEHDRSEEDRMPTVGIVSQTNRLADECRGDVDRVAPPLDLTVLAHPSHLIFSAIFRLTQNAVPTPRRQIVVISWRSIPERFVRSLVIVQRDEATPIGPRSAKFSIFGIRGQDAPFKFMR